MVSSSEEDRPIVVALHGNPGYGGLLRRDTGIDGWHYLTWRKRYPGESHANIAERLAGRIRLLSAGRSVVLVGYSAGGSLIAHLSRMLGNIACAVLYESPMFYMDGAPAGSFQVLWIENDNGRALENGFPRDDRFGREMDDTIFAWNKHHKVTHIIGRGGHWEFFRGVPPVRHCWDRNLNSFILDWIDRASLKATGKHVHLGSY